MLGGSESVPSSVADLLPLATRAVEAMGRASILEVRASALESTSSYSNTQLGEFESQLASRNSEFGAAVVELSSIERHLFW